MEQKIFPTEFVEKITPVNNDMVAIADSEDLNRVKKIKYSNLKGDKGDPILWKGLYSGITSYAINDAVLYNGSTYICILGSTGNLPTNNTYWAIMVQPSLATDINEGSVVLSDSSQVIAGQDTEGGKPLVTQPSHVKSVRDLVTNEALKIKSKVDVRLATTANIASITGLLTVDSVVTVAGDRVLLKDQSTASQNGIYIVSAGAWTRATDFDNAVNNEVDLGAEVWASAGTINIGKQYTLTTTGAITVGSTSLAFTQTYPLGSSDISVRLTKSATQTVLFGYTTITWDQETFDTTNFHDNITNNSRITIPTTGKYNIVANIHSSTGTAFNCKLLLNGTTDIVRQHGNYKGSGPESGASLETGIYSFNAGDYIEVQVDNSVVIATTSSYSAWRF